MRSKHKSHVQISFVGEFKTNVSFVRYKIEAHK